MRPLPPITFRPEDWPDPGEDGMTVLDPDTSARVVMLLLDLINSVEAEYARCRKAPPA